MTTIDNDRILSTIGIIDMLRPGLCFKPASRCLLLFKDELEARKSLKAFFYSQNYDIYSLERFLSFCGKKMSKGFLNFSKLISKLILGQIIVSNLTNVHKLNSRKNYARLH